MSSIYRNRPQTSTPTYSRRNMVSPLQSRPGIKAPGRLRPQTALGKGPRNPRGLGATHSSESSQFGSATFMAPVSMMKVAAEHNFLSAEEDNDADAEVQQIFSQRETTEPIESRIPPEHHMYRSHREYPEEEEGVREIVRGVDGAWKSLVFPSLHPSSREEVLLLESTIHTMMNQCSADPEQGPAMERSLQLLQVLFACMHELGRHVATESSERGRLAFKLLDSIEHEVSEMAHNAEAAAKQAAREAVAAHSQAHAQQEKEREDEVARLNDKYDTAEMNVEHLLSQLDKWEEMQRVFRAELDTKHAEHIAFRREQEAMRKERKELDMQIQVLQKEATLLDQETCKANSEREAMQEQLQEAQQRTQLVTRDFEKRLAAAFKTSDEWRDKAEELQCELDALIAQHNAAAAQEQEPDQGEAAPEAAPGEDPEEAEEATNPLKKTPSSAGAKGGRFARFLAPPKKPKKAKKPKPEASEGRSKEWTEQTIEHIYERKILADLIDDECQHEHAWMPEFVYQYLLAACGSKAAADAEGRELLEAIDKWRGSSPVVKLFADLLEEKHNLDTLNFYLSLKAQIKTSPYGVSYPPRNGEEYIDFFRTLMVSRTVLAPILDMKAIMSFNSKVEKIAIRATDADVSQTLCRAPNGQEKKVACHVYESMCLQVFQKQRKARGAAVKKALFGKKKTIDFEDFVARLRAMDPTLPTRHAHRLYAQAAALSSATGVTYSSFMEVAEKTGLLNQQFTLRAAESARREDPACASSTRASIAQLWQQSSALSGWVVDRLHNSAEWNHIADGAKLQALCGGLEGALQRGSDVPGFKLAQELQHVILFTALAVSQHTVYPGTLEEIPLFEHDLEAMIQLIKRWARIPESEEGI